MQPKAVLLLAGGAAAAAAVLLWRRAWRFERFLADEEEAVRGAAMAEKPRKPYSVTELTAWGGPEPARRFLLRSADVRGALPRCGALACWSMAAPPPAATAAAAAVSAGGCSLSCVASIWLLLPSPSSPASNLNQSSHAPSSLRPRAQAVGGPW